MGQRIFCYELNYLVRAMFETITILPMMGYEYYWSNSSIVYGIYVFAA